MHLMFLLEYIVHLSYRLKVPLPSSSVMATTSSLDGPSPLIVKARIEKL